MLFVVVDASISIGCNANANSLPGGLLRASLWRGIPVTADFDKPVSNLIKPFLEVVHIWLFQIRPNQRMCARSSSTLHIKEPNKTNQQVAGKLQNKKSEQMPRYGRLTGAYLQIKFVSNESCADVISQHILLDTCPNRVSRRRANHEVKLRANASGRAPKFLNQVCVK
jgi:hypothetical protein